MFYVVKSLNFLTMRGNVFLIGEGAENIKYTFCFTPKLLRICINQKFQWE